MGTSTVWALLVILLGAAAAAGILLSRIRTELFTSRFQDHDRITIGIRALFGLFRYRIDVPMVDFRNWSEGIIYQKKTDISVKDTGDRTQEVNINRQRILAYYERARLLLRNVHNLMEWTTHALTRVECTQFVWNTRVGVGDAPATAVATGLVWGVKTSLLGVVFSLICLKTKPNIQVSPQYNMRMFTTELICKLQIRLGYALWAGLRLVPHIWKGKGDWESWRHILSRPRLKSTS